MKLRRWLIALAVLLWGRISRGSARAGTTNGSDDTGLTGTATDVAQSNGSQSNGAAAGQAGGGRIVPEGSKQRTAENAVLVLLGLAVLWAFGFLVTYAGWAPLQLPNELLGLCMAMCLACIGGALTVVAKFLVVTEELEDDYPDVHLCQQREVAEIVRESGSRFTRGRLLAGRPAPPPERSVWRRSLPSCRSDRCGTQQRSIARPGAAASASSTSTTSRSSLQTSNTQSFYTAFAENVDPNRHRLRPGRAATRSGQAGASPRACAMGAPGDPRLLQDLHPRGLRRLALSLPEVPAARAAVRRSSVPATTRRSTRSTGGTVIFGPAGRPLPQLPLMIDARRIPARRRATSPRGRRPVLVERAGAPDVSRVSAAGKPAQRADRGPGAASSTSALGAAP